MNIHYRCLKSIGYVLAILLTLSAIVNSFAQQQKRKHLFQKATPEEGKAFIDQVKYILPRIPGLGYGVSYVLDPNSVKGVESIKIDKEDMVALVYVAPVIKITLGYIENNEQKKIRFLPNGFFVSTVDLVSKNCKIFLYKASGLEDCSFVPKGEYAWYVGREGVMLDDGYGRNWIIFFENAFDEFPDNVLCLMELNIMVDPTAGFQIGPAGKTVYPPDAEKVDPIAFTIKLTIYEKN